jgi:hypothetical protein
MEGNETGDMKAPRFIQRLSWTGLESAAFYEVTVERFDVPLSTYTEALRSRSGEPFLDCSLLPGQYRYQVRPYDLLGQAGVPSEWGYFSVRSLSPSARPGGRPPVQSRDPQPSGDGQPLSGDHFVQRFAWTAVDFAAFYDLVIEEQSDETYREVARVREGAENFVEISLPPGDYRSQVISFDILGRRGDASAWEYFTVLPAYNSASGEQDEEETSPAPGRTFPVFAGLGFKPLFPLPFSEFNKHYGTGIQFLGASAWLAFVPLGNPGADTPGELHSAFGLELNASWNSLSRETADYRVSNQLASAQANLLWQLWFGSGLALNVRFGGGLALIWDLNSEHSGNTEKEHFATWLGSASGDLSLQLAVTKKLFVDFGVEYFHLFSVDNLFLNFMRPHAGIVRRWN